MRPDIHETFMLVAQVLARRSTCSKLSVGCVLVDSRGRILSTGYNGVPWHCVHCIDVPCAGATAPVGSDLCEAVHAEQNAMLQCRDIDAIKSCYVTHAPCMRCTKQLLNTPCTDLYYSDASRLEPAADRLWRLSGRNVVVLGPPRLF